MLCYEGKLSLYCFLGTLGLVFTLSLSEYIFDFVPNILGALFWGPLLYYAVINISLRLLYQGHAYQVILGNLAIDTLSLTLYLVHRLQYELRSWALCWHSVCCYASLVHYVGNHLAYMVL